MPGPIGPNRQRLDRGGRKAVDFCLRPGNDERATKARSHTALLPLVILAEFLSAYLLTMSLADQNRF